MEVSKLFVGNLASSTTENSLRQLFSRAGTVSSVNLVKDRTTGQSKGFAFVTMATGAGAQKAIATLHASELAGRHLTVNLAEKPTTKPPSTKAPEGYQSRLGAFGATNRSPDSNTLKPSNKNTGGYQSKLGAFGANGGGPTPPRRRGGAQRH